MSAWVRAQMQFAEGMLEVSEGFREPLFRQALLLLRRPDATSLETEQADDLQRLLDSEDARNSTPYLDIASRIHHRFRSSPGEMPG